MPRKWLEVVEEFPAVQPDRWYRVRVSAIDKDRTHNAIAVDLEHLDSDQQGRTTSVQWQLPLRPAGAAAEMFAAACGSSTPIVAGRQIAPRDAIGSILQVRFIVSPNGTNQPNQFLSAPQASHTPDPSQAADGPRHAACSKTASDQGIQPPQRNRKQAKPAPSRSPSLLADLTHEDEQRKDTDNG